jgi:hypothetical protein
MTLNSGARQWSKGLIQHEPINRSPNSTGVAEIAKLQNLIKLVELCGEEKKRSEGQKSILFFTR